MIIKYFLMRLLRLIWGLFLYALGIAITLNARIGFAPWDAFHAGLSETLGITIGSALIGMGIVIIIITMLLKETVGLGSILNMLLVGLFLDFILRLGFLPQGKSSLSGAIMLTFGLFIIALATYFYISSAFGAGPRDSLMVALARRSKLPVGVCRSTIELAAALCGWRLGGMVGAGTIISACLLGFCVQLTFRLLRFDPTRVQHQTLYDTYLSLFPARSAR